MNTWKRHAIGPGSAASPSNESQTMSCCLHARHQCLWNASCLLHLHTDLKECPGCLASTMVMQNMLFQFRIAMVLQLVCIHIHMGANLFWKYEIAWGVPHGLVQASDLYICPLHPPAGNCTRQSSQPSSFTREILHCVNGTYQY